MATKCKCCGYVLPQPDPSIIVDHDAIKAIINMFPDEDVKDDYDIRRHMLMIKNKKEIFIKRWRDQMVFSVAYFDIDDTGELTDASLYVHIPPRPNHELTKENVEYFITIVSQLEEEGWTYDAKERNRASDSPVTLYNYPLSENRTKFLELLKKVYTLPMTKRAL